MVAVTLAISAVFAIILGIVILIFPRALNIAIALWLLLYGILQLLGNVIFPGLSPF